MKSILTTLFICLIAVSVQAQGKKGQSPDTPPPGTGVGVVTIEGEADDAVDPATTQLAETPEHEQIFTYVEQMPEFIGGSSALLDYLNKNIRYPEKAKKNGTAGRVYVAFVVRADGSITDVAVKRGIGDGCDEEAIRLVKNMPRWKPAKQNGRPVNVSYILPIGFELD